MPNLASWPLSYSSGQSTAPTIPDPPAVQLRVNQTIYVDSIHGSDATGERATDKAFATLGAAVGVVQNGDTIEMRPGTYTEAQVTLSAKTGVTIKAVGAKLRASVADAGTLLSIVNCSRITVEGLEVDGRRMAGAYMDQGAIDVNDSPFTQILNCYVHDVRAEGIRILGSSPYSIVDGNTIDNYSHAIVFKFLDADNAGGSINHSKILNNRILTCWDVGGRSVLVRAQQDNASAENVEIAGNTVTGICGMEIYMSPYATHWFKGFNIHHNYLLGVGMVSGISTNSMRHCSVSHNVIKSGTREAIEFAAFCYDNDVSHNLIDGRDDAGSTNYRVKNGINFVNGVAGLPAVNVGNRIANNTIIGFSWAAIGLQLTKDTIIFGNRITKSGGSSPNLIGCQEPLGFLQIIGNEIETANEAVADGFSTLNAEVDLDRLVIEGNLFRGSVRRTWFWLYYSVGHRINTTVRNNQFLDAFAVVGDPQAAMLVYFNAGGSGVTGERLIEGNNYIGVNHAEPNTANTYTRCSTTDRRITDTPSLTATQTWTGVQTFPGPLTATGADSSAHGTGAAVVIMNSASGGQTWTIRSGATGSANGAGSLSFGDNAAYRMVLNGPAGAGTISVPSGYYIGSDKVVGSRGSAVADAAGGATVDTEARTALNTLLSRLRTHGLIAT